MRRGAVYRAVSFRPVCPPLCLFSPCSRHENVVYEAAYGCVPPRHDEAPLQDDVNPFDRAQITPPLAAKGLFPFAAAVALTTRILLLGQSLVAHAEGGPVRPSGVGFLLAVALIKATGGRCRPEVPEPFGLADAEPPGLVGRRAEGAAVSSGVGVRQVDVVDEAAADVVELVSVGV